jgi:two-component system, cell cycle sensor histidine kinase and response regulator CckA
VSSPDNSQSARRTVLIVDDETDVLRLLQTVLTEEGYEIITAKNADSAMKAFGRLAHRPDLLLVDVVMPGMSGPMLVERLREIEPDLKVLFMSGYDDRHLVQRYVLDKGFRLIPKPFTVHSLRQAIDAVVKGPKPGRPRESAR